MRLYIDPCCREAIYKGDPEDGGTPRITVEKIPYPDTEEALRYITQTCKRLGIRMKEDGLKIRVFVGRPSFKCADLDYRGSQVSSLLAEIFYNEIQREIEKNKQD